MNLVAHKLTPGYKGPSLIDHRFSCYYFSAFSALFSAINDCSDFPQESGKYEILHHGLGPIAVYCDQANDGGGKGYKTT